MLFFFSSLMSLIIHMWNFLECDRCIFSFRITSSHIHSNMCYVFILFFFSSSTGLCRADCMDWIIRVYTNNAGVHILLFFNLMYLRIFIYLFIDVVVFYLLFIVDIFSLLSLSYFIHSSHHHYIIITLAWYKLSYFSTIFGWSLMCCSLTFSFIIINKKNTFLAILHLYFISCCFLY